MKVKIILISIFLLFFAACKDENKSNNDEQNTSEEKVVEFNKFIKLPLQLYKSEKTLEIKRIDDETKDLKISNNDNKAVMFYFFTTWCPACKAEIPHLNSLAEKYRDNLKIIGVLLEDRSDDIIDSFILENDIKFRLSVGDNNFTFLKVLGDVNAIPYIALYNKKGKNINNYIGAVYEEMLEIDIQKVIK